MKKEGINMSSFQSALNDIELEIFKVEHDVYKAIINPYPSQNKKRKSILKK